MFVHQVIGKITENYMFQIVSNERNSVDVEKWDYFARDSYHLGIRSSFDHQQCMTFLRVIEVDGILQICCRDEVS